MKALPLWQPWASLVAIGAKRVETRGYPPHRLGLQLGQRIAIHATKTPRELRFCAMDPFCRYVEADQLPLGALIAVCTLERWAEITEASAAELLRRYPEEHAFGDYTPGRWAWVLTDVLQLAEPIPFTGSQGTFDVPDELVGYVSPQESLL